MYAKNCKKNPIKKKNQLTALLMQLADLMIYKEIFKVTQSGIEPETYSLEGCCSIQLSYWAIKIVVQKYKKSPYAVTSWGFLISRALS